MEEKIKVLLTRKKTLARRKKSSSNIEEIIEKMVPERYEFLYGTGEKDILLQAERFRPEIVFIVPDARADGLSLLKKIKQTLPYTAVFVFLLTLLDDEQETIDEYMAAGAYKCFLPPLVINTLIHDMYVCLHLE